MRQEQVGNMLMELHPETEEFGCLASHMVVRLINAGHDDVAYNLVQVLENMDLKFFRNRASFMGNLVHCT